MPLWGSACYQFDGKQKTTQTFSCAYNVSMLQCPNNFLIFYTKCTRMFFETCVTMSLKELLIKAECLFSRMFHTKNKCVVHYVNFVLFAMFTQIRVSACAQFFTTIIFIDYFIAYGILKAYASGGGKRRLNPK